jgi:hypothetical protein
VAVSLIPKKKRQRRAGFNFAAAGKNKKGILSFLILVLVFVLYGATLFYEGILNGNITDIDNRVKVLNEDRDEDKENAVIRFDAKLDKLGLILDNHIYSSALFGYLETITHTKVQFTNFNFTARDGGVRLTGLTESYETFGEQMVALKQKDAINNLVVSDVRLKKTGQVEFVISFEVDKSLYNL